LHNVQEEAQNQRQRSLNADDDAVRYASHRFFFFAISVFVVQPVIDSILNAPLLADTCSRCPNVANAVRWVDEQLPRARRTAGGITRSQQQLTSITLLSFAVVVRCSHRVVLLLIVRSIVRRVA
jgi:hypothetical protein